MKLYEEVWTLLDKIDFKDVALRYASVQIPDLTRFHCVFNHSKSKARANLLNRNGSVCYRCFSSNCVASKGLDKLDFVANVTNQTRESVAKIILEDYRKDNISFQKLRSQVQFSKFEISECKPNFWGMSDHAHHILKDFWGRLNSFRIDQFSLIQWVKSRSLNLDFCINYGLRASQSSIISDVYDDYGKTGIEETGLHSKQFSQSGHVLIPIWTGLDYPVGYRTRLNPIHGWTIKEVDMKGRKVQLGNPLPFLGIQCLQFPKDDEVLVIVEGTPDYLTVLQLLIEHNSTAQVIGINKISSRLDSWILKQIAQYGSIIDFTHIKTDDQKFEDSLILSQIRAYKSSHLYRYGLLENHDINDMHHKDDTARIMLGERMSLL